MTAGARSNYLSTQIMTAAPQKLQLMLIEGAIRFAQTARAQYEAGNNEAAGEAIIRCQEIVTELICGLDPNQQPELVRTIRGVYMFAFRALTAAHVTRDQKKLADVLRILEIERETWREVCGRTALHGAPLSVDPLPRESLSLEA